MIKKILLAFILIAIVGYGLITFLSDAAHSEWGHHFNFDNRLGIEIDSLEISIGGVKTMLHAASDSSRSLEGNVDVPNDGYPHNVTIAAFSKGRMIMIRVDSFDCYNCDGDHEYILRQSGAEYRFIN